MRSGVLSEVWKPEEAVIRVTTKDGTAATSDIQQLLSVPYVVDYRMSHVGQISLSPAMIPLNKNRFQVWTRAQQDGCDIAPMF